MRTEVLGITSFKSSIISLETLWTKLMPHYYTVPYPEFTGLSEVNQHNNVNSGAAWNKET